MSHQSKIATRVELYAGAGPDYLHADFARLGYLSLDSNEASSYKARELKSVFLKAHGSFIKLLLHRCYVNAPNLFNQVGLVAVNVLGASSPPSLSGASNGSGYAMPQQGAGGGEPAAARRCVGGALQVWLTAAPVELLRMPPAR